MELVKKNITPRAIVNEDSFHNAIVVDLALGGSTNTVLHLLAIAKAFVINLELPTFDKLSRKVPTICNFSPVGRYHIEDLYKAGGVFGVMKRLATGNLIKKNARTVYLKKIGELLKNIEITNSDVIRPINRPYHRQGGIAVLYGNLAKNGAVAKLSGVPPKMRYHRGPAIVFNNEEEATKAILDKKIKKDDVIVIRYEGPKGGPGMREMLSPTSAIIGIGLVNDVALITDGRFSGGSKGAVIGHISPEAAEGGMIAICQRRRLN